MKFRFTFASGLLHLCLPMTVGLLCLACTGGQDGQASQDEMAGQGGGGGAGGQSDPQDKLDASATPPKGGNGGIGVDANAPKVLDALSLDAASDTASPSLRPAIMAAGYGGFRAISFDEGLTWKNRVVVDPKGGDDSNLIRAVNYVEGMWVAAGWKLFLSDDGIKWTEIAEAKVPGGWYDCVTSDNGRLIVKTTRSDYGGQNGGAIYSDDRGKTWNDANFATRCFPQPKPFAVQGGQLRSQDGIERSTDGKTWRNVLRDCCAVETFAKGMAADPPDPASQMH